MRELFKKNNSKQNNTSDSELSQGEAPNVP
jgi:hypothetical protein